MLVDERASLLRMRILYQRPDYKGWNKYQSTETEFVSLKALNDESLAISSKAFQISGGADGTRTRDPR
ncbi:hypothetical protein CGH38_23860, partial [Vibrio parahaemolyticus]